MTLTDQLAALEKQLSEIYLNIADAYKRMSKVSDKLRLDAMQNEVSCRLEQAAVIREQIEVIKKQILEEWNSREKGTGF